MYAEALMITLTRLFLSVRVEGGKLIRGTLWYM